MDSKKILIKKRLFSSNFVKANEVNVAEWELEYSLLQYYNLRYN